MALARVIKRPGSSRREKVRDRHHRGWNRPMAAPIVIDKNRHVWKSDIKFQNWERAGAAGGEVLPKPPPLTALIENTRRREPCNRPALIRERKLRFHHHAARLAGGERCSWIFLLNRQRRPGVGARVRPLPLPSRIRRSSDHSPTAKDRDAISSRTRTKTWPQRLYSNASATLKWVACPSRRARMIPACRRTAK